ncbi:Tripartite motif-containing protein 9 [Acromyrmex echinatior]|uniref:Tripartite motif-containing protein 9 n=1 Tax=Acromyrmex echinatior TaxID=103372 RepID=F4WFS2_ACREC|nr:Tripartite motif-containing protein 9 [Acromyrmex echinatior]
MNADAVGIVCILHTRSHPISTSTHCRVKWKLPTTTRRALVSGEFDEVHPSVRSIDLKVLSGEESREMRKMINENCGNDSRYCETMPAAFLLVTFNTNVYVSCSLSTARFFTCREFLLLQTELSQNLQQLSERARSTTEFIQRLKGMTDKVHEECVALEEEVEDRVTNLVSLLQARKSRLIEAARQTREARVRSLRDQVARCATHLQATTALLTFCIEALKETDSAAFLQIGGMLSVRAATAAGSWGGAEGVQEIARLPLLDLTLDDKPLRRAIDQLTFVQLKRESAVMGECSLRDCVMSVCVD